MSAVFLWKNIKKFESVFKSPRKKSDFNFPPEAKRPVEKNAVVFLKFPTNFSINSDIYTN